ncbi:MAG: trigger factor [Thiotrichales bacterium]
MQVSVESVSNLERKIKVNVPADRIDVEVNQRLKSMVGRVKIDGFRPGKVPMTVIRQRFGKGVFNEVVGEVLQRTFVEAVTQENLRPAGNPRFDTVTARPGQELEYSAIFEVYPEVAVADLTQITLTVPEVEITETDVDAMVETLRAQNQGWEAVERESVDGDQITIDFEGFVDGAPFENGKATDYPVTIGQGRMIAGFEQQLQGLKAGDEKSLRVNFPDDYPAPALAGKAAEFKIQVKSVKAPKLPEIDAEFVRLFGIEDGSIDAFRAEVRSNMQRELNQTIRGRVKTQVMDALAAGHPVEVPGALLQEEIKRLREQARASMQRGGGPELPDSIFADQARKRVALGLIIGEIIKQSGISLDRERVSRTLDEIASTYETPQEVIEYYRKNRDQMAALEAMVLEDQVVDWVRERAQVAVETLGFDEMTKRGKQQEASA